jgi:hypothetical protein
MGKPLVLDEMRGVIGGLVSGWEMELIEDPSEEEWRTAKKEWFVVENRMYRIKIEKRA